MLEKYKLTYGDEVSGLSRIWGYYYTRRLLHPIRYFTTAPFRMGLKKIDYPKNKGRQPAALSGGGDALRSVFRK
jgi:hypothetical protein